MVIQEKFDHWANGYGVIRHTKETEQWVHETLHLLQARGIKIETSLDLLSAADRLANAAMWLVVHMTYANKVNLDGKPLSQEDFNRKAKTDGRTEKYTPYI